MLLRGICLVLTLHLTVCAEKFNDDILKNYSEFFNFGGKKVLKLERERHENDVIKSKMDVLGAVFKHSVEALKANGAMDLVFLIDASSSVGEANFLAELKFVKKFLSDVTVDYNHTRVAIVTFSSQNNVIKNIDEVSKPNDTNNKCLLLNNEMNEIKYSGGGTYTIGAFQTAQEIFNNSRNDSRRVLFLITDGYSNGGDPVPVAKELKASGVTIFTIGIINGNYKELYALSSEPGELYSYLLESFEEFESLARKALHVDLQIGDYIPLGLSSPCDKLCNSTNCCDQNALCTCGTSSGHYTCLCKPGYYGSGLVNSCSTCPSGSYSSGPNLCLPCPDVQHITKAPAIGIGSCTCKSGYQPTKNHGCEVITCSKLSAPDNGYFVKRKDCSNVLNSACGVRCNVGYTLIGSSIRLCQANNSWSGLKPSCQVKTCNKLHVPQHGSMYCKHFDLDEDFTAESLLPVDTVCNFACEDGRMLVGSSQRTCLPLARWDGLRSSCKQIKCNKLSKINFGTVEPKACTLSKQVYGTRCNFTCKDGYELVGPSAKSCTGRHGNWDSEQAVTCQDVEKPEISCPDNIETETELGKPYGLASWSEPNVTDNSEVDIIVWTKPAVSSFDTFQFKIGKTKVSYFAQDAAGNTAKCSFFVIVKDKEPPTVEFCNDPLPFLTTDKLGANITWDEPQFFDNSQVVKVSASNNATFFEVGTHNVSYLAEDSTGNSVECTVNITIQEAECNVLPDPLFGHSECKSRTDGVHCVVTCEEGYAIPLDQSLHEELSADNSTFLCENSHPEWYIGETVGFPECSVSEIPVEIVQTGVIEADPKLLDSCENESKLQEIENDIKETLQETLNEDCNEFECTLHTQMDCEEKALEAEEEQTNVIKREVQSGSGAKKKRLQKIRKVQMKFRLNAKNKGRAKQANFERSLKSAKGMNLRLDKTSVVCYAGSVARKMRCVTCPSGTFHNTTSNSCQSCDIGYYTSKSGQTNCLKCPKNYSTRKLHSKSLSECIEQCPPGTFARKKQYKTGKHPNAVVAERITLKPYCSSCPLGQYQPDYTQLSCIHCPNNLTTYSRGVKEVNECVANNTKTCNNLNICSNGQCILEENYLYSCVCPDGYVGSHCEIKIDYCSSLPCQNNGLCSSGPSDFLCRCPDGYEGKDCGIVSNKCGLDCKNNGTCVFVDDEEICSCLKGFESAFCEVQSKHCEETTCFNGGTCNELYDGFNCTCVNSFIGFRCAYLPCDYRPCTQNQTCTNVVEEYITRNSYKCECPAGYTGKDCNDKINYCSSNPCRNGAECKSFEEIYKCFCKKGFAGDNCELTLKSNYVLNFPRSTTTDYISMKGFDKNLTEISVCFWMKTNDKMNYGTILSYATRGYDNAFTLTDYTGLVFYVNNNYIVTDVLLNDDRWHHVCVTWTSNGGNYRVYLDGRTIQTGSELSAKTSIEGSGALIVGQEQDILGGRFSQSEAFLGRITYLDFYGTVINNEDVIDIMTNCTLQNFGDLYAWPEFLHHIKGDIEIEESEFCGICKNPGTIFNGDVKLLNNKAYYSCKKGFRLNDAKFDFGVNCSKAVEWEITEKPICKPVNCGRPKYIPNAYILGQRSSYLDKLEYKCKYGYNLTGSSFSICTENGTWDPQPPTCKGVICKPMVLDERSIIKNLYDDDELEDGYQAGDQVEVSCAEGSKLEGQNIFTCLNNGSWDYEPPQCVLEKKLPVCAQDYIPTAPDNGYLVEASLEKYLAGETETIEYACREGYKTVDTNTSTCIVDGYWSELKLSCPAITCRPPPKFPNMVPVLNTTQHVVGSMLHYNCVPGYKPMGKLQIWCLTPGVWNRITGRCIKLNCGKPPVKPSTQIIGKSYLFGGKVKLICASGEVEIKCDANGKWAGDFDAC